MSDEDQSTNHQLPNLSLNLRNNLQLQPLQLDGDNSLIRIGGTTNIDNSNVENIYQLENVENLTINFTQNIIGPQQNIQVTNSRINEATTSTTANAEVFDEQKFRNYFVRVECRFKDIASKERPITEDMYDNLPIAIETSFEQLSNRSREQITQEGTTQLSQAFPVEGGTSSNRVVAIIGEPGAGKSVYLITLRSYYIKNDFFVFSLDFLSMNSMNSPIELITFAEFLLNCACPDFPYKISTIWLCNSDDKCVFLIDGLDQAPHIINQNESIRNINSHATVSTWLSLLYLRKIMKRSKIVYTSRPSSVVKLAPSQQPDLIYKLIGFSEQSIVGVISTYNSEHAQEIVTFINSKGPNLVRFSRNPFILALISLVYKTSSTHITTETTITEIYQLAIHQLSSAIRSLRGEYGDAGQNQRGEEMVDRFYYENFIENKISFTEDDVLARNLSMEILETFTLINIDSNQFSLGLEPKQKMITPQHQNVMEFHIARYMVTVMDIERFTTVVNEEMFDLYTQDRWNMIRRFIAGLINTGKYDEGKRGIFLNKLVTEMKNVVSRMLSGVCEGDASKYHYLVLYQSSLFNDITEMNRELEFIKSSFAEMEELNFNVILPDEHSLYGLIYLLRHIDPHLKTLVIKLSNDVKLSHFNELAEAIKSLSEKVLDIHIRNMPGLHENMDKLGELIRKSKQQLMLSYPPRVNIGEIEAIKQNLQSQINQLQSEEPPNIRIDHRNCSYLIRHSCYTNMTSSFIMPYLDGVTLNLMQCRNRNIFSQVENFANICPWKFNFSISQQEELEILIKFLVKVKQAIIEMIELIPTSDVNWNVIRMFCNKIGRTKHKVQDIYLYNMVSSEIDIYYVRKLWSKVQRWLYISYKNEISDEEVDMWVDKLEDIRSLCTECLLCLKFKNFRISCLPPTNQIMITISR